MTSMYTNYIQRRTILNNYLFSLHLFNHERNQLLSIILCQATALLFSTVASHSCTVLLVAAKPCNQPAATVFTIHSTTNTYELINLPSFRIYQTKKNCIT